MAAHTRGNTVIVQELMSQNPVTVTEDTPVSAVAEVFQDQSIRHLPILRDKELVGMVSERDIRSLFMPRLIDGKGLDEIAARYSAPISSMMTIDVIKVYPETDIREVVDLMVEHRVGAIPVVDSSSGDLRGIVSYIDVLRVAFESS